MKTSESKSSDKSADTSTSFFQQNEPFFKPAILQPKLKVGRRGDKYEQEADRVADAVVNDSAPQIQRQPMEEEEELQMKSQESEVQLKCSECDEEDQIQTKKNQKVSTAKEYASSKINRQLSRSEGKGSYLPQSLQKEIGNKIGADFSGVNIHTDSKAVQMNQALGARAFTHGRNIFFNEGEYNPGSTQGKHLLAHELTHVVQQGKGDHKKVQKKEADESAKKVSSSLDSFLEVGEGFMVEISGGVTWGVPVYTGSDVRVEVMRASKSTVQFIIYKKGRLGLDTGVGVAAFIGRKRKPSQKNDAQMGVGAKGGVNAGAGVEGVAIEQYNIPAEEFMTMMAAIAALQSVKLAKVTPTAPGSGIISLAIESFLEESAEKHLVRTNIETGLYGELAAEISAGLSRPTQHTDDYKTKDGKGIVAKGKETWKKNKERKLPGKRPRITEADPWAIVNWFVNKVVSLGLTAEMKGGIDFDKRKNKKEFKVYFEGQIQALIGLPIPFIDQILSTLPTGAGGGVEVIFTFKNNKVDEIKVAAYQFSGEDEIYQGSANKQTFVLNITNIMTPQEIIDTIDTGVLPKKIKNKKIKLKDILESTHFWNRFMLFSPIGRRFRSFSRRRVGTRSLLSEKISKKASSFGIIFNPYLTLDLDIPGPDFIKIAKKVSALVSEAKNKADGVLDFPQELASYFTDFENKKLKDLKKEINKSAEVKKAELRIFYGMGFGVSGKIAKGAKARLDLGLEGGRYCAMDLAESGKFNLVEISDKLIQVTNNPTKHIPNCLFLRDMYNAIANGQEETDKKSSSTSSKAKSSKKEKSSGTMPSETLSTTNKIPGEMDSMRPFRYQIFPRSMSAGAQPGQKKYKADLGFYLGKKEGAKKIYFIELNVRVVKNNSSDGYIVLKTVEDVWIDKLNIGFKKGTTFKYLVD